MGHHEMCDDESTFFATRVERCVHVKHQWGVSPVVFADVFEFSDCIVVSQDDELVCLVEDIRSSKNVATRNLIGQNDIDAVLMLIIQGFCHRGKVVLDGPDVFGHTDDAL